MYLEDYILYGLYPVLFILAMSAIIVFLPVILTWYIKKSFSLGRALLCAGVVPVAAITGFVALVYGFSHFFGDNSENIGIEIALGLVAIYVLYWITVVVVGARSKSKGVCLFGLVFWSVSVVSMVVTLLWNDSGLVGLIIGTIFFEQFVPLTDLLPFGMYWVFPIAFFLSQLIIYIHIEDDVTLNSDDANENATPEP